MIVKMKKISIVAMESVREESIATLRALGVVHLSETAAKNEMVDLLENDRSILERSLSVIPDQAADAVAGIKTIKCEDCILTANMAMTLSENRRSLLEEIEKLEREAEKISIWGDFDPAEITGLRERGIDIRLYELTKKEFKKLPGTARIFIINKKGNKIAFASITLAGEDAIPVSSLPLPGRSMAELKALIDINNEELEDIINQINGLSSQKTTIINAIRETGEKIAFERAMAGMGIEGSIAHLTGFIPETKTSLLEKAAQKNGWALLLRDPADEDIVPTLVENPKWIRIIEPIFRIIGTIPGYKEFDISFWFLLFFSLFFAIIVGDGGYGLLFFLFTFIARRLLPKAPAEPFILLYTMSTGTVIWGLITGTWFGSEYLAKSAALSKFVIPQLASFAENAEGASGNFMMQLCFIIGTVHLTIAHLKKIIILFPHPLAFSDLGWMVFIWGCFFIGQNLVLGQPLNPVTVWLIGIGFGLVIIFSEQKGNFFKGVLNGLASAPLKILSSMSAFSDLVSYVRLFAVGLASLEVAKSFNAMASAFGFEFPGVLASALILFFGHSLNITLSAMSLIVHGVRLNMLEFSGHLGMEWTGIEYKPFKKEEGNEIKNNIYMEENQ